VQVFDAGVQAAQLGMVEHAEQLVVDAKKLPVRHDRHVFPSALHVAQLLIAEKQVAQVKGGDR
jgi:hypothetical protein